MKKNGCTKLFPAGKFCSCHASQIDSEFVVLQLRDERQL
jgi:hypothetical protein